MPSHFADGWQSLVHVPEMQFAVHSESSSQSKLQKDPVQVALHFASSRQSTLQGPEVHVTLHVDFSSQRTLQTPVVHRKLHVSPFVQVQFVVSPHSFALLASTVGVPEEEPPLSVTGVPLDDAVPLLPPEVDVELLLGAPLPIVQS